MTGVDTNALVQAAVDTHLKHAATRAAMRAELDDGHTFAVTPAVLGEFLHIVTDPRRFEPAWPMTAALDWAESWVTSKGVVVLPVSEASLQLSFRWLREFRLGRKRILDTQLAAALHVAGVSRLITSNPGDFNTFGVLELIVP